MNGALRLAMATILLLGLQATQGKTATLHVEVVDETGSPLEPADVSLKGIATFGDRQRLIRFSTSFFTRVAAPSGAASQEINTDGIGLQAVLVRTARGVAWATVDVPAGEAPVAVKVTVSTPGRLKVGHRSNPRKGGENGLAFDDYDVELGLYRDGLPYGAAEMKVKRGERAETVFDAVQPGKYTLVGASVHGHFTWVKSGVQIASGKTASLEIPTEGGTTGGAEFLFYDKKTRKSIDPKEVFLLLPDQPVALNPAVCRTTQREILTTGFDDVTQGQYILHVEMPGYKTLHKTVSLKAPLRKREKDFFGKLVVREVYPAEQVLLEPE